ncbi:MAG TPA: hypothetical protein VES68_04135 [Candidatus Sulfotelmatobacter sp.]|nr:hypothetical protein [Candidatus Sulfotelmatobacter sp.]
MALNIETQRPPDYIPPADLRREEVVKKLIDENRAPFLFRDEESARCFIPPINLGEGQTMDISIADAKEIASIRDKLLREH